jgi:hypothetical protein
MKNFLLAVTLLALLIVGSRDVQGQAYGPYPYWDFQYQQYQNYVQWQQYLQYLQQYDPYYDLHVMHYQLYLQPYQPYQLYQPCCYSLGVTIPAWSRPFVPALIPRFHGAVGPLPRPSGPRQSIRRR